MNDQNSGHAQSGMDRKIVRSKKKPQFVAASVVVRAAALMYIWATLDNSTSFTLDGQRIRIAEVSSGVYEDYIPLRATVEPERTVYLDSIEGGRVEAVLVEEGAFVEVRANNRYFFKDSTITQYANGAYEEKGPSYSAGPYYGDAAGPVTLELTRGPSPTASYSAHTPTRTQSSWRFRPGR